MSDLDGLFETIDAGGAQVADEPVQTEAVAEGSEAESTTAEETQTNTQTQNTETEESQTTVPAEQATQQQATSTETVEPSQTETNTSDAEVENWKETLPPAPVGYVGPVPEVDENGVIVNMTPEQYDRYQKETVKAEIRQEMHSQMVESRSFEVAEKILPEIKSNPAIRRMVENARIASVINGQVIDNVEAAKQVREALGLAPAKLAEAQAQGAQNAKASITIQKNAALETNSTQKAPDTDKMDTLQKRIKRGDDTAFVEMLDIWTEAGKI